MSQHLDNELLVPYTKVKRGDNSVERKQLQDSSISIQILLKSRAPTFLTNWAAFPHNFFTFST